jgi:histidine kinase
LISDSHIPITLHKGSSLVYLASATQEFPTKHVIKTMNGASLKRIDGITNEYNILKKLEGKTERRILKKGLYEGKPAIWLNYIDGVTLDQKNNRKTGLRLDEFLNIARGMAGQLKILHDENIIHKDLNLRNFIINQKDNIFLLDFQLSVSHEAKYVNFSNSDFITGTFETISPEQTGRVNWYVDNRSDLYSLGILFYELVSGKSPFKCNDPSEFIYAHLTEIPPTVSTVKRNIPDVVSAIIDKLIRKNPAERYQSVEGLLFDLNKCLDSIVNGSIGEFEIASRDVSKQLKVSEKLYGKEGKLQELQDFFFNSSHSQLKLGLLEGESGTGKNTLAYSMHGEIAKHNGVFLQGKFRQDNVNRPLSAFVDIVNAYIQVLQTKPEEHIVEWKRKIQSLLGHSVQYLFPFMPNLEELLELENANEDLEVIDNQNRIIYLVAKLIYSLSNPSFPIVIYIDDIHWADENSFNLIQFMLNMTDFKFMNIIGSFRREEANNSEAFKRFEQQLSSSQFPVKNIFLQNFTLQETTSLLADSLDSEAEVILPLANEVFSKTEGNPFFVSRFLQTLYEDGLLWMDGKILKWKWNIEGINEKSYTNNVVSLLVNKLNTLNEEERNILQFASCFGYSFPSEALTDFRTDLSKEALEEILSKLVKEKMIYPVPIDSAQNNRTQKEYAIDYQFSHDKLFEAANQSLKKAALNGYHWAIGKKMIQLINTDDYKNRKDIFNLANHLNLGGQYAELSDYESLYRINLEAGFKAKSAGSFLIALDYFQKAETYAKNLHLNSENKRNIQLQLAECLQFTSDFESSEKKYRALLLGKPEKFEKAKIGEKLIHFYSNTGRHEEAYQMGVSLLNIFGKNMSIKPSKPRLLLSILKSKLALRKYNFSDLLQLPESSNEEHIAVVKIFAAMLKSAYQIAPELCVEGATKMVRYCARHGNTIDSPVGYFVFGGIFLGGVFGNHEAGYNFGNLSLDLIDRYKSEKQRSEIEFIHGYFSNTWVKGASNTAVYFDKSYKSGSLTGDFFHMSCSRAALAENMFLFGTPLDQVKNDSSDFRHFVKQSNNKEATIVLESIEAISNVLMAPRFQNVEINLDSFKEDEFSVEKNDFSSLHFIHMHFINRMALCFHEQNIQKGIQFSQISESLLEVSAGLQHSVFHHFYTCLLLCSKTKSASTKADIKRARKSLKFLAKCADFNQEIYESIYLIALSYNQNFKGKDKLAIETIQKAIIDLKSKLEVNLLGIASEHLSRLYWTNQNSRKFHESMSITFEAYNTWGATAILERLKTEFRLKADTIPSEIKQEKISTFSSTISASDLDISSIMKFSRAITEEINLDNLVKKVLKIMVENTASTCAYLVIKKGEIPYLYGAFVNNQMESMQKINLREHQKSSQYPVGMIHYAIRTKQVLLIDNAMKSEFFATNNYVVNGQTKSVLCQPLLMQQKTIGVLYLDSNMSEKLYNNDKVQMLQLLSTQIAISINNSMNFEAMEQTIQARTEELSLQKEIIEKKNKEIGDSIQYARTIQEAILPSTDPFSDFFRDYFLLSKPKDIVSGDFFWIEEKEDTILFAVADCTGHGVPAAMLSLVCNNALKRSVREMKKFEPAEILDSASEIISTTFSSNVRSNQIKKIQDGMDISICSYNKTTKTLKYSGANNPLLILTKAQSIGAPAELLEIKGDKQPVGPYFKTVPFTQHEMVLKNSDVIILSTDGYYDQFGGEHSKKMKAKAFKQFLIHLTEVRFTDYHFRIDSHFQAWKGEEHQLDDVTVLGIEV